jgi:hypothetical protein
MEGRCVVFPNVLMALSAYPRIIRGVLHETLVGIVPGLGLFVSFVTGNAAVREMGVTSDQGLVHKEAHKHPVRPDRGRFACSAFALFDLYPGRGEQRFELSFIGMTFDAGTLVGSCHHKGRDGKDENGHENPWIGIHRILRILGSIIGHQEFNIYAMQGLPDRYLV